MISKSALENIHLKGQFGDYVDKNKEELLKISEIKDLFIMQIVQYKNSQLTLKDIEVDGLKMENEPLKVISNEKTRILWNSPKNWTLVSSHKELIKKIPNLLDEKNFALTDLSHSRAIFELEGRYAREVLKKGCPFNFNTLEKNNSLNSTYNGISFSADMIDDNPDIFRLFTLRSFGESFYHSITDASLEYGYEAN